MPLTACDLLDFRLQAEGGAAGDAALRRWWRGGVGMSKEEQVAHFQALADIEDLVGANKP